MESRQQWRCVDLLLMWQLTENYQVWTQSKYYNQETIKMKTMEQRKVQLEGQEINPPAARDLEGAYQTKLRSSQKEWVKKAAEDIQVRHVDILQMAVDCLINGEWDAVKIRLIRAQAEKELAATNAELQRIQDKRDALLDKLR